MSDYIKREDALAVIYAQHIGGKEACENARPNTFGADLREIASDIEDIPAADVVERKRGEWIWTETGDADYEQFWVCSECGEHNYYESNFCPNCGADCRGGNDGT